MLKIGCFMFILIVLPAYAQDEWLYMPLNFEQAYDKNTRSYDGMPGANYWQNHSDYNINASIDPASRTLTGSESITYSNNSPNTLDTLVIRLYQNINRLSSMHDFPFDTTENLVGINLTSLSIDGVPIQIKENENVNEIGTNLIIKNVSIPSHSNIKITAEWNFKIPSVNRIRMGAYDSTTFFIAYWYPQIAVYDDIDGWDLIQYTGLVEFYNDFNNFDVTLNLPNNMCMWATGILQNPDELFKPDILSRYNKASESDKVVHIISNDDYSPGRTLFNNSTLFNSWHFKAENVPDFTFGISDHYLWDSKAVNNGERNVLVSAAYNPDSKDFYEVCEVASTTVEMLSKSLPAYPFPWPKITVFNGEGGMESPMMVNESSNKEHIWMDYVTTHEVTHSYFPFYMGCNERKYAWMDEGWTQMLSEPIQWAVDTSIDFRARDVFRYENNSGYDRDFPMMARSDMIKGPAYGNSSYFRPAAAYNTLKELLGDELFKKALQEYIKRWHGKHPTPYDFFYTFEDVADDDFTWFWKPWFFDGGYPDQSIDTVIVKDDKAAVLVDMEGRIPTSVMLKLNFTDGTSKSIFKGCSVWKDEDQTWIEEPLNGKKLKFVELGSKHIPDVEKDNKLWELKP